MASGDVPRVKIVRRVFFKETDVAHFIVARHGLAMCANSFPCWNGSRGPRVGGA